MSEGVAHHRGFIPPLLWAMLPDQLEQFVSHFTRPEFLAAAAKPMPSLAPKTSVNGSTVVIYLQGVSRKAPPAWLQYLLGVVAMADGQDAVNAAAADTAVSRIVLVIDSPGGSVTGTADLAAAVSRAAEKKE